MHTKCLLLAVAATCLAVSFATPPPAPFQDKCKVGQAITYNQTHADLVPTYEIDLDAPPSERWNQVALDHSEKIKALLQVIKSLMAPLFHGKLVGLVDKYMGGWDNKLPEPYLSEIKGIANVTGMELGEVVLYNIFYEVFSVCTSIVAADPQGNLIHARNLDFGLFMGWNHETHNWDTYEALRPLIINVKWMKGGKEVFRSNQFAGYIGVYNGLKKDKFTVTMNERFNLNGGFIGIFEWLFGLNHAKFSTFLVREVMEQADSYENALVMLMANEVVAPCYYIVGGTKAPQGAIVTRGRDSVVSVVTMNQTTDDGWYVLQTNYDPGMAPLFLDDRRTPGKACMNNLTSKGVSFEGVYQVLDSVTNKNKLTEYTVLMNVATGEFETHLQSCEQPCWAW
jgi:acid ceramidase